MNNPGFSGIVMNRIINIKDHYKERTRIMYIISSRENIRIRDNGADCAHDTARSSADTARSAADTTRYAVGGISGSKSGGTSGNIVSVGEGEIGSIPFRSRFGAPDEISDDTYIIDGNTERTGSARERGRPGSDGKGSELRARPADTGGCQTEINRRRAETGRNRPRFRRHIRSSAGTRGNAVRGRLDENGRLGGRSARGNTAAFVIIAFFAAGFVSGCAVWNTGSAKQQCAAFVESYMSFARGSGFAGCFRAGLAQQLPVFIMIVLSAFFVAGFAACPVIVFVRGLGTAAVICSLFSRAPNVGGGVSAADISADGNLVSGSDAVLAAYMRGNTGGAAGMAAAAVYLVLTAAVLIAAASDAAAVSSDISSQLSSRGTAGRCARFLLRAVGYAALLAAVSALHAGAVALLK